MDDKQRKIAVAIGIAVILLASVAFGAQQAVATYSNANMPLGHANCSVELGMLAMKDGVVVNSPIMNNPLYLDGVEIDAVQFTINVRAEGSDVDWNTLSVTCVLTVNGLSLNSWEWSILDFTSKDGGFEVDASWTIDELDYLVGDTPDYTDADGIGHFELRAEADVYGDIEDVKDNPLTDSVKVTNTWDLTDANEATPDPLIVPSFTLEPSDMTVDYGQEISLTWKATDDNPSTYEITLYYLDGGLQTVDTGSWTTSTQIIYTADALWSSLSVDPATGNYPAVEVSVTCFVFDNDGQ
jgi:hypothetical protein